MPSAVDPTSLSANAMLIQIMANPALLTLNPTTVVLTAIFPDESALTMALVFHELSNVLLSIGPD